MKPPQRKNTPPVASEEPFKRGDVEYLRRNYEGGTVDLIFYDDTKSRWIYEIYEYADIPAMNYDFEECLSSPVFYMRYLSRITVKAVPLTNSVKK